MIQTGVIRRRKLDNGKGDNLIESDANLQNSRIIEAVKQGIDNPLIIQQILQNLTPRDLMTCRLVNTTWCDLSTKILIRRKSLSVTFWFSICPSQWDKYTKNGQKTLEKFNTILKFPHNLPYVSFNWRNLSLFSDVTEPHLEEFLDLYGPQIRSLRLSLVNVEVMTFAKLLRDKVPNLESLHVERFPPQWEKNSEISLEIQDSPQKLILPKLTNFKFDGRLANYGQIVQEILRVAPNLKFFNSFFRGSVIQHLSIFSQVERMHAIKSLQFEPTAGNLNFYESFIKEAPNSNLKKCLFSLRSLIQRPQQWPQACDLMSQILELNSNSLSEIGLVHPMPINFSRQVRWLPLPKVCKIEISIFTTGSGGSPETPVMNLPSYDWSEIFPNLNCVALVPIVNHEDFWETHVPFKGAALSVRRLEIHFPSPEFSLENLHEIFPNVRHLEMKRVTDFPRVGRAIWNLKKLRQIDLQLDIDFQSGNGNIYPAIDSTFTGFTEETCRKLKYSRGDENHSQILDDLRSQASLLDLQYLENLNLELCYWTPFSSSGRSVRDSYNLMTNVTGIYAFSLMPQLKVHIVATSLFCEQNLKKIQQSLASIKPYVSKLETSSIKPAEKVPSRFRSLMFYELTKMLQESFKIGGLLLILFITLVTCLIYTNF